MTPYLVLVLVGFGVFVVVLGVVSTQDYLGRLRQSKAKAAPARIDTSAPQAAVRPR